MSFIQVCPQYAKNVEYYATPFNYELKLKSGEKNDVPILLQRLTDGSKVQETAPSPILLFSRAGFYKVTAAFFVTGAGKAAMTYMGRDAVLFDATWTRRERPLLIREEKGIIFRPGVQLTLQVRSEQGGDVVIENVLVKIEYIE